MVRAVGPVCFVGIETVDGRVIEAVEVGALPIPVFADGAGIVGQVVRVRRSSLGTVVSATAEVEAGPWDEVRNAVGGCHVAPDLLDLDVSYDGDRGTMRVSGTLSGLRLCPRGTCCGAWGPGTYLLSQ